MKVMKGKDNSVWKGDDVGYSGIHHWLTRNYGSPKQCEYCGVDGRKKGRLWSIQWANRTGLYKRSLRDWLKLCQDCHTLYDQENPKENMKKDKVQDFKVKLYPDQLAALTKVAEKRRVSRSQLIREVIDKVYNKGRKCIKHS